MRGGFVEDGVSSGKGAAARYFRAAWTDEGVRSLHEYRQHTSAEALITTMGGLSGPDSCGTVEEISRLRSHPRFQERVFLRESVHAR